MANAFSGKFNRQFILAFEASNNENITVTSPFTLEFTIVRNNLASANTATFIIYNLNATTRGKIYKDVYDISTYRAIQLFAGYYNETSTPILPMIFNGNIKRAYSTRQGPDFRTEIEAFDGQVSMAMGTVSQTLPAGTPTIAMIKTLVSSMSNIKSTTVGNKYTDASKRGTPMMGNPMQLLNQLTNNGFYIDSGNAYAIDTTEAIKGDIQIIDDSIGLLGTPKKMETLVEIEMLFEPRLKPSQLIQLVSTTEPRFNGVYKITGLTHRGIISGAIGGEARTIVTMEQPKDYLGYSIIFDQATNDYKLGKKT